MRDKGRYEYDWSRKVWAVKGGGDVVNVPQPPNEGSFEHDSVDSMELESEDTEDTCTEEEGIEPVSEETLRLMETTRGLRLDRFCRRSRRRRAKSRREKARFGGG